MTLLYFAAFFAVLGIVHIVLPYHIGMTGVCLLLLAAVLAALWLLKRKKARKGWSAALIALTALAMAVVFGAMALIVIQGRDDAMPDNTPEFVVVLGAQVHGSEPSLTLKKRLERAYEYMTEHPEATVFVSGGQGPDETQTEASVMAAYLERKGIASERIVQETQASDTRENLIFSAELAEKRGVNTESVLIITSDFHMTRAKYIARTLGMTSYGLTSSTWPWVLKVNYELREVFAFVKAWWKAHTAL